MNPPCTLSTKFSSTYWGSCTPLLYRNSS